MNPELNRLSGLLNESIDRGEYVGASVMVIHKGEEIYYTESGYADVESGRKIARDTIFRIYSQSKPITGTAAVISPVGELKWGDKVMTINNNKIGPISQKIYDTMTGIQWGKLEDPFGWVVPVK